MRTWMENWKIGVKDKRLMLSSLEALVFLFISLLINFYAGVYATERASNYVTDIVLSNTRVYDLDSIFIYGSWILVLIIIILCIYHPKRIPFLVKTISLFVLIRAIFLTLTHLGPFPNNIHINPESFISYFVFGGDLFFSGHTGLPFLLALVFWENKFMRLTFIAISIMFAIVVLLAHLHYSIDVLAAFFITYSIFHIALFLFKKDRENFFK